MAAGKTVWKVVGGVSGLLAARASKKLLDKTWIRSTGAEPPRNPASPGTSWPQALSWAAVTGAGVAIARMVAARGAAQAWRRTTGSLPPGVDEVGA